MLSRLLHRKKLVILGLNSGTSADGLDLAVVRVDRSRNGYRSKFLAGGSRRYPVEVGELVHTMADAKATTLEKTIYLDQILGQFYGRCAAAFIRRLNSQGIGVDAVASHGQTVRHLPRATKQAGFNVRGSLQLGSLDQISAHTGKVVVGDFRQADIALGNEGAPISVAAMERLLSARDESRLIVNIGGMANYFFFPSLRSGLTPAAADCGPGNSLSDILSQKLYNEPFDHGGRRALKGRICLRLLSLLRSEPFFSDRTRSTGRETFGVNLAERLLAHGRKLRLSKVDMLTTAAEFTVVSIIDRVHSLFSRDRSLDKLYLTGGGVHNRFFSQRLRELLDGVEIGSVALLGFNPDLLEASAYAVMAEACLRSEALPTQFGRVSRRKRKPILGRIVQPAQKR